MSSHHLIARFLLVLIISIVWRYHCLFIHSSLRVTWFASKFWQYNSSNSWGCLNVGWGKKRDVLKSLSSPFQYKNRKICTDSKSPKILRLISQLNCRDKTHYQACFWPSWLSLTPDPSFSSRLIWPHRHPQNHSCLMQEDNLTPGSFLHSSLYPRCPFWHFPFTEVFASFSTEHLLCYIYSILLLSSLTLYIYYLKLSAIILYVLSSSISSKIK